MGKILFGLMMILFLCFVVYFILEDARRKSKNKPLVFINEDKRFRNVTPRKTRTLIKF